MSVKEGTGSALGRKEAEKGVWLCVRLLPEQVCFMCY